MSWVRSFSIVLLLVAAVIYGAGLAFSPRGICAGAGISLGDNFKALEQYLVASGLAGLALTWITARFPALAPYVPFIQGWLKNKQATLPATDDDSSVLVNTVRVATFVDLYRTAPTPELKESYKATIRLEMGHITDCLVAEEPKT